MEEPKVNIQTIALRLVATFVTSAIGAIGVGAFLDVAPLTSAAQAGGGAVLTVVLALANAYQKDGKLDDDEVQAAFDAVDKK
jgi:hypothetical protein